MLGSTIRAASLLNSPQLYQGVVCDKNLKLGTQKIVTTIVHTMEQFGFTMQFFIQKMQIEWQTVWILIRAQLFKASLAEQAR